MSDVQEQRNGNLGGCTGRGFMPGRSGNPGGRPRGRSLTAILREALDREHPKHPGRTVGEVLVDVPLEVAERKDRRAILDIFNRLEGRAVQAVELSRPAGDTIPLSVAAAILRVYGPGGHRGATAPDPDPAGADPDPVRC
jgi:hypothetical protein